MANTYPVIKTKDGIKFPYINFHSYYSEKEGEEVYALSSTTTDPRTGKKVSVFMGYTPNVPRAVRWSIAMQQLQSQMKISKEKEFLISRDLLEITGLPIEYRPGKFEVTANRYGVKLPEKVPYDIIDMPKEEAKELEETEIEIGEIKEAEAEIEAEVEAEAEIEVNTPESSMKLHGKPSEPINVIQKLKSENEQLKATIQVQNKTMRLLGEQLSIANNKIEEQNETIARFTDKMLDLL